MSDLLLVLGTVFFAISGAANIYVEYRRPGQSEIANRLRKERSLGAPEADEEAKKIKARERLLWFFIPWIAGMCLCGAGIFLKIFN